MTKDAIQQSGARMSGEDKYIRSDTVAMHQTASVVRRKESIKLEPSPGSSFTRKAHVPRVPRNLE